VSEYDLIISEREDFDQTLATVDQITREFDNMTSRLIMDNAQITALSEALQKRERTARTYDSIPSSSQPARQDHTLTAALQQIDQSMAAQNALGKDLCDAATDYANNLILWAESLDKRMQNQVSQQNAHGQAAATAAVSATSDSAPAGGPDLDGKIKEIQEAISIEQQRFEATEQSIQNLRTNSPWWDIDSNSLIDQFTKDAHDLNQNIIQLKNALQVYQTAKATYGVPPEELIEKVQAVYGYDWQEYFHQRILLGLDEKGPYWDLGEGEGELEHLLTGAATMALTFAVTDGMDNPIAPDTPSSAALGQNLEDAGIVRPSDSAAHHIVAGRVPLAAEARSILQSEGIGINDAENGVFLPKDTTVPNSSGAQVHSTVHTNIYYNAVNAALRNAAPGTVAEVLQDIADQLQNGTFPH